ncbi:MAG: c-type cytochrome biogenesis protein CcsB [Propionibacteriaceae bacterium]|nr:c-type cytochrome biogenesis protein CcsB [Propionibacteriaceae bacterium]
MVTSAVIYLLALIAHAIEWASARRPVAVPELVGAGAGAGAGNGTPAPTASEPSTTDDPAEHRVTLFGRIGVALTLIAALSHVAGVVLRGVAAERFPWGNMYEFVTSSLAFAAVFYLVVVWRKGWTWLGLPVTLLLSVGQGLAVTVFYVAIAPLVPALHSVWFIIHIVAAAIAGAAFNVAAIAAILYLIRQRAEEKGTLSGYLARLPHSSTLDDFSFRLHRFAFPLWTFTILAGAVWADYAWGRFWGWDPKETWSLVTWVVYAAYLHARVTAGWKGRRAAWLAVVGVATFWFNFIGVNLLAVGLHSYAGI